MLVQGRVAIRRQGDDVLIGNYLHAHVGSASEGRTLVFDEFPDDSFETALAGSHLAGAVTRYIQGIDALPYEDHADLLEHRDDPDRRAQALAYFDDVDPDRDPEQAFATDGHALAPLATYTILPPDVAEGVWTVLKFLQWAGIEVNRTTHRRPPRLTSTRPHSGQVPPSALRSQVRSHCRHAK